MRKCYKCGEIKDHYANSGGCKDCRRKLNRDRGKDGMFYVYYIPSKHYCGITNSLTSRMYNHKESDFKVLQSCSTREEARHLENLFHSLMGMNGMKVNG